MLGVVIEHADGGVERAEADFADIGDAAVFALELADRLGRTEGRPARFVRIFDAGEMFLTISVVIGGLLGGR